MIKKIFRPFWSYDVKNTEDWLHSMALQGYRFKAINTVTRQFTFEGENHPQAMHYHIEYDKTQTDILPTALKDDGWMHVFQKNNWYVLSNEKPADELKCYPVRDGVIRRNRFMMYVFAGMFIYILLTSLFFAFMSGLMLYFGYSLTFEANTFWILALIIGLFLWTLAPYSAITLYKTNSKYW